MLGDFAKAIHLVVYPDQTLSEEKGVKGYWPIVRFFLVVSIPLAVLTPVVNWFGVPCDIVHAGTNAQMGAYLQAPLLEASTGISRYLWVALLTYIGNALKLPLLALLFHLFARLIRGSGSFLDSFKVGVYSTAPVLLFGWVPYFGLISGLWVGYLYVIAFWKLHETRVGPTIAFVNLLIGVQLVWAFLFGWLGSSAPW